MKILVCVKQAPPSDAPIKIDDSQKWVSFYGHAAPEMGKYDECAVEQALIIKEQVHGTTVDAMTTGPAESAAVVRRALGMGADHGIHALTSEGGYVSALKTVSHIAGAVRSRSYDLILTGVMSDDLAQGLVGPMLAETLSYSCATSCVSLNVNESSNCVYTERDIEGGRRQLVELVLPALLTMQSSTNRPRYPSLSNIIRANSQGLEVITVESSEDAVSCEKLLSLSSPQKNRSVIFLEGSSKDKARELLSILRKRSLLH